MTELKETIMSSLFFLCPIFRVNTAIQFLVAHYVALYKDGNVFIFVDHVKTVLIYSNLVIA